MHRRSDERIDTNFDVTSQLVKPAAIAKARRFFAINATNGESNTDRFVFRCVDELKSHGFGFQIVNCYAFHHHTNAFKRNIAHIQKLTVFVDAARFYAKIVQRPLQYSLAEMLMTVKVRCVVFDIRGRVDLDLQIWKMAPPADFDRKPVDTPLRQFVSELVVETSVAKETSMVK